MSTSARKAPCPPTTVPPETISTVVIVVTPPDGAPGEPGTPSATEERCDFCRPSTLPGDPERPVSRVLQEEVVHVVAVGEAVRRIDQPHERRLGHDDLLPLVQELAPCNRVERRLRLAIKRVCSGVLPAGVGRVGTAV